MMVKPDGVQRALVGEVVTRFENRGYKLVASKMIWVCYFLIDLKHVRNRCVIDNFGGVFDLSLCFIIFR